MNYIDKNFLRGDFQQIQKFLLHGVEQLKIDQRTYKERLEVAQKRVTARLHEEYPDSMEYEQITGLLFDYAGAVEAIYMEISLQVETILASQVFKSVKTAFQGE